MLIEQFNEFKLIGAGPLGLSYTPITGYFHNKAKIPNENLQVIYFFAIKILQEAMYVTSHRLGQITYKN